jgi:hypothetical protein
MLHFPSGVVGNSERALLRQTRDATPPRHRSEPLAAGVTRPRSSLRYPWGLRPLAHRRAHMPTASSTDYGIHVWRRCLGALVGRGRLGWRPIKESYVSARSGAVIALKSVSADGVASVSQPAPALEPPSVLSMAGCERVGRTLMAVKMAVTADFSPFQDHAGTHFIALTRANTGGSRQTRTADPLLVRQVL